MKRSLICCLLGVTICLTGALRGAAGLDPPSVDQSTAVLFDRVLRSQDSHGIKPATVISVAPYVRPADLPPLKPHTHIHTDKLYCITSTGMFSSFLLTPTRVILEWQSRLVPSRDKTANVAHGTLGELLETEGKRLPNHASVGPHGIGASFLMDMDQRQPLLVYHVVGGKLVRVDE